MSYYDIVKALLPKIYVGWFGYNSAEYSRLNKLSKNNIKRGVSLCS